MIIDIKQLEDVRAKFMDFSSNVRDLVAGNKEYFDNLEKNVKSLTEISGLIKSIGDVSFLQEHFNELQNKVLGIDDRSTNSAKAAEILKDLSASGRVASDRLDSLYPNKPAEKKKTPGKKGILSKEASAIQALVVAASHKLMLPIPGNILATTFRWMIHGVKDRMAIEAGAGELKNLLVAGFESGSEEILNATKQKLSNEQVILERFYGVSKGAIQATTAAFVNGGVSIRKIGESVDKDLGLIGESLASFATAVDLRLNLAQGSAAKGMVGLVTTYNESIDEASRIFTKLAFLGKEAGVGPEQFIDNVTSASSHLTNFGISTEYVAEMMLNFQERLSKMGLEKQFAGKFVAEGMEGISSGIKSMSDNWKALVAEKMGWGAGIEGVMAYDDQLYRLVNMTKGERREDFQKLMTTIFKVVEDLNRGNIGAMYLTFKDYLGFGMQGAQLMIKFGDAIKNGDIFGQHDISDLIRSELKSTLTTEAEKTNKFQLLMNQWLTYVGQIGRGILALLIDMVANIGIFMANIKEILMHVPQMISAMISGKDPMDIFKGLKWTTSPGLSNQAMEAINQGRLGMENVMRQMGESIAGDQSNALFDSLGVSPSRSGESNFIMIPVSGGSAPVRAPIDQNKSVFSGSGKGKPKSVFDGTSYGEPLQIVVEGVDEQGNLKLMLKGNCPQCGLYFGEGVVAHEEDSKETSNKGTPSGGPGRTYESREVTSDMIKDMSYKDVVKPMTSEERQRSGITGVGKHTPEDVEALARVIRREAGDTSKNPKIAATIAHTVLNRARNKGKSVSDVVTGGQGFGKQGPAAGGMRPYATPLAPSKSDVNFAKKVLSGEIADPSGGKATGFFHTDPKTGILGRKPGNQRAIPAFAEGGGAGILFMEDQPSSQVPGRKFVATGTGGDTDEGSRARSFLESSFEGQ